MRVEKGLFVCVLQCMLQCMLQCVLQCVLQCAFKESIYIYIIYIHIDEGG